MKGKVVFEQVRFFHYPLLLFYLLRGDEIAIADFDYNLKEKGCLRFFINRQKIDRLYISPLHRAHGEAIDQTEKIFAKIGKENRTFSAIASLYGTPEAGIVFKRILLDPIFRSLYLHQTLSERGKAVCFIPHAYLFFSGLIQKYGDYSFDSSTAVIPKWAFVLGPAAFACERFFFFFGAFFYLFFQIAGFGIGRILFGRGSAPKHFRHAMCITQPLDFKFENKRGFDFLLSPPEISRENTLFLVSYPLKKWIAEKRSQGYALLDIHSLLGFRKFFKAGLSWKDLGCALLAFLKIPFGFRDPAPFSMSALKCLHYYLEFGLIRTRAVFDRYIYTNLESAKQLAINILVRQNGGETWNYSLFIGGGLLYVKNCEQLNERRHILWAFLNSDHYLAVNSGVVAYHRLHHQTIGHYHVIGSIYSEMVRDAQQAPPKMPGHAKVLSFFDTTYCDTEDCPTSFDDAIGFYRDILRLAETRKDLRLIVKPAKNEAHFIHPRLQWSSPRKGETLMEIWNLLKKKGNVCWAGESGDMPAIMAESDLVVTHCMSSPTVEALGAGKKAIWYEPGLKHRGVLYDSIPNLILHGFEELESKLDYFLDQWKEEDYKVHAEKFIRGRVEYALDGQALTRFRQLLIS